MRSSSATLIGATVAAALLAGPVMAASRGFAVTEDRHSNNEASFVSKAVLVKFTGRTSKIGGNVSVDPQNLASVSGSIEVDLGSLDTGIGMRNEHMRGYLEAEKFPKGTFTIKRVTGPKKLDAEKEVIANLLGDLSIHGVTKSKVIPVKLTYLPETDPKYRPGEWVHAESDFPLDMSEFGINLPDKVVGIKVSKTLDIHLDTMLKAQ